MKMTNSNVLNPQNILQQDSLHSSTKDHSSLAYRDRATKVRATIDLKDWFHFLFWTLPAYTFYLLRIRIWN